MRIKKTPPIQNTEVGPIWDKCGLPYGPHVVLSLVSMATPHGSTQIENLCGTHMGPSVVHWLEIINKQIKSSCRDLEEPEPEPGQPVELAQR